MAVISPKTCVISKSVIRLSNVLGGKFSGCHFASDSDHFQIMRLMSLATVKSVISMNLNKKLLLLRS